MDLLKYIIYSITIVLITSLTSFAQDDEDLYVQEEIKEPLQLKGIKFGINVGRFSDFQFKPDRRSYEASLDVNISNKYFGVLEAGYSEINMTKSNYSYYSDGTFVKIGFDKNMLKKVPSDYLGIGLRLGWSSFSHTANDINLDLNNWGNVTFPEMEKSYNAYWFEASFGVKGEIFKNVYLGWSGLVRIQFRGGKDSNFQAYDIPGFGDGSKSLHLAANYYIYYQIPFNRNK
jgi:hypothetical protein